MSANETSPLQIESEASAWEILERLLADEGLGAVEFYGWPSIGLKIEGDRYSATLPSGLMRQVSEIQNAFNRCYAQVAYSKDARSIKHAERDELELIFEIREGSTEIKADATGLLDRLGDAMKKPSTANTAAITLVALALIICGTIVTSNLSSNKKSVEEKRLQLLEKAIEKAPELKDATPEFQKIYRDIVASASDADRITIGEKSLTITEISTVASTQRNGGQRVDLVGSYRVDAVRRFSRHCLVDVVLPNGDKVRARIVFDRFPDASVTAVLTAVARNTPIQLSVTAMKHEDGYSSARITAIGV